MADLAVPTSRLGHVNLKGDFSELLPATLDEQDRGGVLLRVPYLVGNFHERWFWSDLGQHIGAGGKPIPPEPAPTELDYFDNEGSVGLVGCRSAGGGSTLFGGFSASSGVGELAANFAVEKAARAANCAKINGFGSETDGLGHWLNLWAHRTTMMLPEGAIKGGSAMALRYGRGTRFTQDLDAARVRPLARFRSDFEDALATGWAGFTGRLVEKAAPRPSAVPTAYVMQPFEVRLDYRGRPWCTVKFELGHNEIGDADEPEYQLASDLGDLVDLQLIDKGEDLDFVQVRTTCARLFEYRRQQPWPPTVAVGEGWGTLYEAAIEDVEALPDVEAAVAWVNAS